MIEVGGDVDEVHVTLGVYGAELAKYEVRISFAIFTTAWQRGFELSPATVRLLETIGAPVGFSIYAEAAP